MENKYAFHLLEQLIVKSGQHRHHEALQTLKAAVLDQTSAEELPTPEEETTSYWECEHCTTINGLDKNKCLGCGKERVL